MFQQDHHVNHNEIAGTRMCVHILFRSKLHSFVGMARSKTAMPPALHVKFTKMKYRFYFFWEGSHTEGLGVQGNFLFYVQVQHGRAKKLDHPIPWGDVCIKHVVDGHELQMARMLTSDEAHSIQSALGMMST